MGLPTERHYDSVLSELAQIRELLDAQSRRVQPALEPFSFNVSANGVNLILPGLPGNRYFINVLCVVASASVTAAFGSSQGKTFNPFNGPGTVSGGQIGDQALATNGGFALALEPPFFIFRTEPGQGFAVNLSSGTAVGGFGTYWIA